MALVHHSLHSDLHSLSFICDGITGTPLIRINRKTPLEVCYEGTSFLLELADLRIFNDYKLGKCEWKRNGKSLKLCKCLKCHQICGQLITKERASVFCENCIKNF